MHHLVDVVHKLPGNAAPPLVRMKLQPLAVSMLLPPPSPMSRSTPPAFAAAKRQLDPGLLFRNNLWDSYLEAL